MKQADTTLRLGKRYEPQRSKEVDLEKLLNEQSVRSALLGALLAVFIVGVIWVAGGLLFDQFFPWFSVILGLFIGRAVRHYGLGLDWRFPLIAAVAAVIGAFLGSFASALFLTGREFDTSALALLGELTWHTVATFATREFGTVGTIYAGMAAAVAAFFAKRRLDRYEAVALRKYREGIPG
ncbi:MAG: hypothetical protein AAGA61_06625 [Pseudomonadota bacterium]